MSRADALGHLAGVDEDERGAVVADEVGHPVVDLLPLLVGADGVERGGGDLDGEVEVAPVADVDEGAVAVAADEEPRDFLEGLLGRGEADALGLAAGEGVEPLEREGEVRAALVARDGVDLVDDDGADGAEHAAPAGAREEDVERLRGRDEDVGRRARHLGALGRGRVAGADEDADVGEEGVGVADLREGPLEVLLDVVAEGLEGRDVEDARFVGEVGAGRQEAVDRVEEGGEGLAAAGGGGDQRVPAGADEGPALNLGWRRAAETSLEPLADRRMESLQRHRTYSTSTSVILGHIRTSKRS